MISCSEWLVPVDETGSSLFSGFSSRSISKRICFPAAFSISTKWHSCFLQLLEEQLFIHSRCSSLCRVWGVASFDRCYHFNLTVLWFKVQLFYVLVDGWE
ncbi:hypothetical protein T4B_6648 [Trichinella pseudospiralis]|uniref:Uncharacterized protein n=1 Tax=Trichinella pseudospiralis TaxID=6337 RepID=A0A0V1IX21_TRIPS|nr:hypothetical protein T4B_6648 [Trichinella pseudospiralis]